MYLYIYYYYFFVFQLERHHYCIRGGPKPPERPGTPGDVRTLVGGLFLIMLYACLRFDDVLHSAPEVIDLEAGALRGVAWQTKVERRKKGTPWSATRGSITGRDWATMKQPPCSTGVLEQVSSATPLILSCRVLYPYII